MKKIFCMFLIFVFCIMLSACGETVPSEKIDKVNVEKKIYEYKAYGLQNIVDVDDPIYSEDLGYYIVLSATARCPECGDSVSLNILPEIHEEDFGKETILWEGRPCCTNKHDFFNGFFDVAIQLTRVDG